MEKKCKERQRDGGVGDCECSSVHTDLSGDEIVTNTNANVRTEETQAWAGVPG